MPIFAQKSSGGASATFTATETSIVAIAVRALPSARISAFAAIEKQRKGAPRKRTSRNSTVLATTSPDAPKSDASSVRQISPAARARSARATESSVTVNSARSARSESPAPRLRDTTEAPPTPMVIAMDPRRSWTGNATDTPASPDGPTARPMKTASMKL